MTNFNLTDVTVLIDRSLSMSELVGATVSGFNAFLDKQRDTAARTKKRCELQLIQFDDDCEVGPRLDVSRHPMLKAENFVPRGHTALLDAIGRSIDESGQRFEALPDERRPGKVVFVILTDGADDASHMYSAAEIREKIRVQSNTYQWDFIYLGANQDAWHVGQQYGFTIGKTLSTEATGPGTEQGFKVAADYVSHSVEAPDAESALENQFTREDIERVKRASNSRSRAAA
jgi:hypothetical protein